MSRSESGYNLASHSPAMGVLCAKMLAIVPIHLYLLAIHLNSLSQLFHTASEAGINNFYLQNKVQNQVRTRGKRENQQNTAFSPCLFCQFYSSWVFSPFLLYLSWRAHSHMGFCFPFQNPFSVDSQSLSLNYVEQFTALAVPRWWSDLSSLSQQQTLHLPGATCQKGSQ